MWSAFQGIQWKRFEDRILKAGRFKHLLLNRTTSADEANSAIWLFASQLLGDADTWGEMSTRATAGEQVQRWLRFSLLGQ
jgi:hypothetical protein